MIDLNLTREKNYLRNFVIFYNISREILFYSDKLFPYV